MGDNTKKEVPHKKLDVSKKPNTTVSKKPPKRAKSYLISKSALLSVAPKKSQNFPQTQKPVTVQMQNEA